MEVVHRALGAAALAAASVAIGHGRVGHVGRGDAPDARPPDGNTGAAASATGTGERVSAVETGKGPRKGAPRVVGHRGFGAGGAIPENTLAAVRASLEAGAAGVEIDARLTADGKAVALHDAKLDRTTTCSGCVSEVRAGDLSICRIRGGERSAAERVPMLGEVFELVRELPGEPLLLVDAKSDPGAECPRPLASASRRAPAPEEHARALGARIGALAESSGMARRTFVYGDGPTLEGSREASPGIGTLRISESVGEGLLAARRRGFSGISLPLGALGVGDAARLHREGLLLDVYVANTPGEIRRAERLGADFVETDRIESAISLLGGLASRTRGGPL